MNAPHRPQPGINAFHRDRSKCIDAFANLEAVVSKLSIGAELALKNETFGEKLKQLKRAAGDCDLSASQLAAVRETLGRCEILASVRNDIVHSVLQIESVDEINVACFTNVRKLGAESQPTQRLSLANLRVLTIEINELAADLRSIL